MDDFVLELDLNEVIEQHKDMEGKIRSRLALSTRNLAAQTHAHVKEEAASKLHTRLEEFNDNLDFEQIDTNTYSIVIRAKARWIEDGMQEHSMLEDLLSSPKAKRAKDGSKYIIIPFKHNKGPTQQTPHQREILRQLKGELKRRDIPYGKLERNPDGSPKMGLLHKFDFSGRQDKPKQGAQGPASFPMNTHHTPTGVSGPAGRPFLHGVRIYQHFNRSEDGTFKLNQKGNVTIGRSIMTFRVASSKHEGGSKWFHPGVAPKNFLDEALIWAENEWDTKIVPEILRDLT